MRKLLLAATCALAQRQADRIDGYPRRPSFLRKRHIASKTPDIPSTGTDLPPTP